MLTQLDSANQQIKEFEDQAAMVASKNTFDLRRAFTAYGTISWNGLVHTEKSTKEFMCLQLIRLQFVVHPSGAHGYVGGAPPEKKHINDVSGKNKRDRRQQFIPNQKEQKKNNLDVTLQYYSIVSLAKNILEARPKHSLMKLKVKTVHGKTKHLQWFGPMGLNSHWLENIYVRFVYLQISK